MTSLRIFSAVLTSLLLGSLGSAGHAMLEFGFLPMPQKAAPDVAMAFTREARNVEIIIRTQNLDKGSVDAALGIKGASGKVILNKPTSQRKRDDFVYSHFVIPEVKLVSKPSDWENLRLAFQLTWKNQSGSEICRDRYRHTDVRAVHAPLATSDQYWDTFDVAAYERFVEDQKNGIRFHVKQPMDSKLTVVIEDSQGRRVRNLISGEAYPAGEHTLQWDALNEDGQLVPPGSYQWRSVSHPGVTPEYKFAFANGGEDKLTAFGSNHSLFQTVTHNNTYAFLAAPMTEGGESLIAVDKYGKSQKAYHKVHGTGLKRIAVAANEKWLYTVNDGPGWGDRIKKDNPKWKINIPISLTRFNVETEKTADFPGKQRFANVVTYEWGPGSKHKSLAGTDSDSLRGMALLGNHLYISLKHAGGLLKVDAATGKAGKTLPIPSVGFVVAKGKQLYVGSGIQILALDPETGKTTPFLRLSYVPTSFAFDERGDCYVVNPKRHQVEVYSSGKKINTIGTAGGDYQGKYDPSRMVNPTGVAVVHGNVWIAENRKYPKRIGAWDAKTGMPKFFKYGNPEYGSPSGGMDTQDESRWIGLGTQWKLDFKKKTATPTHILHKEGGHLGGLIPYQRSYRFFRKDGRTFIISKGRANLLSELMPNGSVKDLAFLSSVHSLLYQFNWKRVPAYCEVVEKKWPKADFKKRYVNQDWRYAAVFWADGNDDGKMQSNEIQLGEGHHRITSGWGDVYQDDVYRFIVDVRDKTSRKPTGFRLVTLKPNGYSDKGVPNYPSLSEGMTSSVSIDGLPKFTYFPSVSPKAVDRFGNVVAISSPMVGVSASGRFMWRYQNQWANVHGSHKAPLPQTGVTQGTLFVLGMAPFDEKADVFIINGNHGRYFVITSDGFYLDEMFTDVRVSRARDEMYVGGEPFGGSFAQSQKTGRYYLQTGSNGYRLYQLHGLDKAKRDKGRFTVSKSQIVTAERQLASRQQGDQGPKVGIIAKTPQALSPRQQGRDFPDIKTASWKNGSDALSVKMAYDATHLYLHYEVKDNSPWVNNGKDWQVLFKTGDSVDLQLAVDPKANPRRTSPVPGDLRVMIAPFEGKPLAVLYKHRVPGAASPVTFTSPWRSEKVDEVKKLTSAEIHVSKKPKNYTVTAKISRKDLGLSSSLEGFKLKADIGVLFGDGAGTSTGLRSYWSNKATGLVSDVPGEIMLFPQRWGHLTLSTSSLGSSKSTGAQNRRIRFSGILGNSGESGKTVARHAKSEWFRGIGVVVDSNKRIYDRAGSGLLNRYTLDGRVDATFPIQSGMSNQDSMSIVKDTIVLLLREKLYTLSTAASSGTKPKAISTGKVHYLSAGNKDGKLLLAMPNTDKKFSFAWFDPVLGTTTKATLPHHDGVYAIEVLPDGSPVVQTKKGGLFVYAGDEHTRHPEPLGARLQFVNGYWYSHAWHGTMKRFGKDFKPDPGVVMGGNSGSFIGTLAANYEMEHGQGIAHVDGDLYVLSGAKGIAYVIRWDRIGKRFVEVLRLGGKPATQSIALDYDGNVFSDFGAWKWDDTPGTPMDHGFGLLFQSQSVMLPNDTVLTFGRRYGWNGYAAIGIGSLNAPLKTMNLDLRRSWDILSMDKKRHYYGATWYTEKPNGKGQGVLLVMDDKNQAHSIKVSMGAANYAYKGPGPKVNLKTKTAVKRYRSLTMFGDDILLASGDGHVIRFERDGRDWKEVSRFNGGKTPFGSVIDISCAGNVLWVSDTNNHVVHCLDAQSLKVLTTYAHRSASALTSLRSPTTIAAKGDRAVVYDSGNQRLVKFELK